MAELKEEIFQELKKILKTYSKGMRVSDDSKTKYALYGKKKITFYNREFDGMYFGSAVTMKNHVTLYFFPQYTHPQLLKELPENLKKCLKGKSCFHIKKNDPDLMESIKKFVKLGYDTYKKSGMF